MEVEVEMEANVNFGGITETGGGDDDGGGGGGGA